MPEPWSHNVRDEDGNVLTEDQLNEHMEGLYEDLERRSFLHWDDTFGSVWDAEDLRQDAIIELLDRAKRDGHIVNLNKGFLRHYHAGLVTRAIQAQREGKDASAHLSVNSANMRAFREYASRVDAAERERGRPLTNPERDAIAEQLRDDWHDPKRKPTRGFHRNMRTETIDTDTDHYTRAQTASAEESFFNEEMEAAMGSREVEYLYSLPRQGGARKKAGWNAICKINGIPVAPLGALNNRQIAECRKHIDGTKSNIIKTLEAWEEGEDSDRTEALFRPFGAVTKEHRNQIAELFHEQPDNTPLYWEMAVAGATKRNFKGNAPNTTP